MFLKRYVSWFLVILLNSFFSMIEEYLESIGFSEHHYTQRTPEFFLCKDVTVDWNIIYKLGVCLKLKTICV